MNAIQIEKSIAYCGLICALCSAGASCSCKINNHCSKKLSADGCFQYDCCTEKGLDGCWECSDAPCDKDMFTPIEDNRISARRKLRAFISCIKEDGIESFSKNITKNAEKGVVYHKNGVYGDYDLETEEKILHLLRTGEKE